mgnify:CR=1 FL=1
MIKNIFLFALVIVVASIVGWQYYDQFGFTLSHTGVNAGVASSWGAFGDYIGGVLNPFIAGVGLVFFIITLRQNEKALRMSADELKLTRQELKRGGEAQKNIAEIERINLHEDRLVRQLDQYLKSEQTYIAKWNELAGLKLNMTWSSGSVANNELSLKSFAGATGGAISINGLEFTHSKSCIEKINALRVLLITTTSFLNQYVANVNRLSLIADELNIELFYEINPWILSMRSGLESALISNNQNYQTLISHPSLSTEIVELCQLVDENKDLLT